MALYIILRRVMTALLNDETQYNPSKKPKRAESWECIKCGRVYPFWVFECPHCQPKSKKIGETKWKN